MVATNSTAPCTLLAVQWPGTHQEPRAVLELLPSRPSFGSSWPEGAAWYPGKRLKPAYVPVARMISNIGGGHVGPSS